MGERSDLISAAWPAPGRRQNTRQRTDELDLQGTDAVRAWLDIRYAARTGGPVAEFSWGASTRAISAPGAVQSNPALPAASSDTSTSTWATTPASSASRAC